MFQLTKQSLISFLLLSIISVATGWFLVWEIRETKEEITQLSNSVLPQQKKKAFDSYNKTLARHKITGVKDLEGAYKKVTVSNGEITFSFEVPDTWLTETRNSGEVEMNEEELREFLGTNYDGDIHFQKDYDRINKIYFSKDSQYSGINWDTLKNMSRRGMLKCLSGQNACPGTVYPNATVSPLDHIYYSDKNIQIDFFLKDKTHVIQTQSLISIKDLPVVYQKETEILKRKIEKKEIDLMESGQFFSIDAGHNKIVQIWKQTYSENFEEDFRHIIDTLTFE